MNNLPHTAASRRRLLAAGGALMAGRILPGAFADGPTTTKGPIRIGQIGVGHGHASKLSVYRQNKDFEVVGIVEPDEKLRKQAENQPTYAGLPWLTREQLLATKGLQAVLVETRIRDLLENAEACIDAGKHIHLDKPAGDSLDHFRRILGKAERQKLTVQLGYMYRYSPAVIQLREFLQAGWLGEIFELHTVMSKVLPPADRVTQSEYAGGMMFELGCHVIDLVIGLMGKPDAIHAFPRQTITGHDTLLDNMLTVFEYPKATATVRSAAVEVDGGARRQLTICGTQGTYHIQPLDNPKVRMTLDRARGTFAKGYQDVTFPRFERYIADARDMAQIIRGEKPSDFSYAHELTVQESVLRASGLLK